MLSLLFSEYSKEKIHIYKNSQNIIRFLASDVGERTIRKHNNLNRARDFIRDYFNNNGGSSYEEIYPVNGVEVANIITEIRGTEMPDSIIVLGAHYDTVEESPGADDNGSAVAALLEVHRLLAHNRYKRTIRFIAFTLEEPPYFSTDLMGSRVYAGKCRKRGDNIELMVCLEMLGYGSRRCRQDFPLSEMKGEFPKYGDFLGVISLPSNAPYVFLWKRIYNEIARHKIYDFIGPASIPGMDLSDHISFIKADYPAIMLSDTAFYRNKNYHTPDDTYDTINFRFLTENILYSSLTLKEILNMDRLFPHEF